MGGEVLRAAFQGIQVLVAELRQRHAPMRLERPNRGNNECGRRLEMAIARHDVGEFLQAEIRPEAGFRYDDVRQLERDLIGEQ